MRCSRTSFPLALIVFGGVFASHAQTFTTLKSFGYLSNKVGTVTRSPLVQVNTTHGSKRL